MYHDPAHCKKKYQVCDVPYYVHGAMGCVVAEKGELATANSTENFSISWLLMPWLSISLFFASLRRYRSLLYH